MARCTIAKSLAFSLRGTLDCGWHSTVKALQHLVSQSAVAAYQLQTPHITLSNSATLAFAASCAGFASNADVLHAVNVAASAACSWGFRPAASHAVIAAAAAAATLPPHVHSGHNAASVKASKHLLQLLRRQVRDSNTAQADLAYAVDQQLQGLLQLLQNAGAVPHMHLLSLLQVVPQLSQPPPQLLTLLMSSVVQSLPQLQPHQLAAVLSALNACGDALKGPIQIHKRALSKAVNSCLQHQQHAFGAASTAAVAVALAKLQLRSSFSPLSMLAVEHQANMSAQQLADLLHAFAVACHYNQAVADSAIRHSVQLLKQQGYKLGAQQDAASSQRHLTRLVQQRAADDNVGRDAAADDTSAGQQDGSNGAGSDRFLVADLTKLLDSCRMLRHHDAELLVAAGNSTLQSLKVVELQHVVAVVHACASLNHYNISLFQEACRLAQQAMAAQQQQGSGSKAQQGASYGTEQQGSTTSSTSSSGSSSNVARMLTDLAWSCAMVGHVEPAFIQQLAAWSIQMDVTALGQQQLIQWFQVQASLADAAVQHPELRSLCISNTLLVAAQEAWMQQVQGQQRLTPFHKEVHEALRQVGKRCAMNLALDGPLVVDVVLKNRRPKVALQLETPDMFAVNPPHVPLGATASRWRSLQMRGWQVVSLRYSDWVRKSPEARTLYMWDLRESSAAAKTPGLALNMVHAAPAAAATKKESSLTSRLWKFIEG